MAWVEGNGFKPATVSNLDQQFETQVACQEAVRASDGSVGAG
jgi:hypothetical protein